jgi:predicted transcriptional regulator
MKHLTFKQWIYRNGGPTVIAKKLNISRRTIYNWLNGVSMPSIYEGMKLIGLSKKQLTIESILKDIKKAKKLAPKQLVKMTAKEYLNLKDPCKIVSVDEYDRLAELINKGGKK